VKANGQHKRVAIVQSCYIPWKGYFDVMNLVDEFILFDDRQFTRRDWRNRNRIKTARGTQWLTIPVVVKGRYHQRIDETRVSDSGWATRHFETLRHAYRSAPFFDRYEPLLADLYRNAESEEFLSRVNRTFLEAICSELEIETRLSWSSDYAVTGSRTDRLVELCRAAGATSYLSGPSAQAYLEEEKFAAAGIDVDFMDYSGYAPYDQIHPPFDHAVTIIDLLVHTGSQAPRYMKSFGDG
jgi:hypothetical protein